MLGLQVGHDFGFVKVEADYSYYNFDANGESRTLEASIHNIFSRLILERELNDKIDFENGAWDGDGDSSTLKARQTIRVLALPMIFFLELVTVCPMI